MSSDQIRVLLDAMDTMKPGVAVRKGTDGFWYASYVPRITPPSEVKWTAYRNPLDAMRHQPEAE